MLGRRMRVYVPLAALLVITLVAVLIFTRSDEQPRNPDTNAERSGKSIFEEPGQLWSAAIKAGASCETLRTIVVYYRYSFEQKKQSTTMKARAIDLATEAAMKAQLRKIGCVAEEVHS